MEWKGLAATDEATTTARTGNVIGVFKKVLGTEQGKARFLRPLTKLDVLKPAASLQQVTDLKNSPGPAKKRTSRTRRGRPRNGPQELSGAGQEGPPRSHEACPRSLLGQTRRKKREHYAFSTLFYPCMTQRTKSILKYELARRMLLRSLELCPGYAPANNHLGLVSIAEGRYEDAISCFDKSL
uniref:Uncharacterized protein n=1 Tax=Oryza punctata TaxID=4537 RepID=A0A0E0JSG9_ORYPU